MKPTDISHRAYNPRLTQPSSSRVRRPSRLPTVIESPRFGRYLDRLRWIFGR